MLPYSPPDISSLYYPSLNTDIIISLHMPNVPKVRLLSATRLLIKVLFLLTLPRRPRTSVLRTAKELPTTVLRLRRVSYAQASRVLSPHPHCQIPGPHIIIFVIYFLLSPESDAISRTSRPPTPTPVMLPAPTARSAASNACTYPPCPPPAPARFAPKRARNYTHIRHHHHTR